MARTVIAEDDEAFALVFTHVLCNAGHTPFPAPTGRAALVAARAQPEDIAKEKRHRVPPLDSVSAKETSPAFAQGRLLYPRMWSGPQRASRLVP